MGILGNKQGAWCWGGLALVLLLMCAARVHAELPPSAYEQMQRDAPEALQIAVQQVKTTRTRERRFVQVAVTVRAEVTEVRRSATHLKVGDVITFQYVHRQHREPVAGPSEIPILKKGECYPAYLKSADTAGTGDTGEAGKAYEPAARSYSFRELQRSDPAS